ncbi:MAG: hypothetical protein DMF09_07410 [Verrucomicrobia bacterium]|nr:MAG: hypothetical protein DMF09_07410 [Verrucomicrobiota bacterium]
MFVAELRRAAQTSKWVRIPLGSHWLMLVIASVLFALVAMLVDLKPVVDENFFFSTNDPGRSRKSFWRCGRAIFLRRDI